MRIQSSSSAAAARPPPLLSEPSSSSLASSSAELLTCELQNKSKQLASKNWRNHKHMEIDVCDTGAADTDEGTWLRDARVIN